ncbi:MAG: hypothetical protein AAGD13_17280 [Pseudomonadota bacterium]
MLVIQRIVPKRSNADLIQNFGITLLKDTIEFPCDPADLRRAGIGPPVA